MSAVVPPGGLRVEGSARNAERQGSSAEPVASESPRAIRTAGLLRPGTDSHPTRVQLVNWIGDAVTAPLGYAAVLWAPAPALVS
ncbi:hypothetical protein [Candidatus Poriferisodalis sp.]|uniref:hypothetical protein n=1 Tax=Candidatus Poriferisodalis sp. TaxID=3101277 RepID=UPI003D11DE9C